MGARSMNYLVLKVGAAVSHMAASYLQRYHVVSDVRGSLFIWETNIQPLYSREGKGESCTADLDEEVVIQRYLGTLNPHDFRLMRAGDECGMRGQWEDHGFREHEEVMGINASYAKLMSDGLV
jgi:hypothetical protein